MQSLQYWLHVTYKCTSILSIFNQNHTMRNFLLILIGTFSQLACKDSSPQNTSSESTIEVPDTSLAAQPDLADLDIPDTAAGIQVEFIYSEAGFNQEFNLRAYISDPDDAEPTNMRNSPNGKIIQKLPQGEDYMFHIIAQNNGWFQIEDLICFSEEIEISQTTGWIHGSVVGASNRACDKKGSPVYKYPAAEDSLLVGYVPMESSVKIKRLYFDFVEIDFKSEQGKSRTGWMHQDCICGNPVTTCP